MGLEHKAIGRKIEALLNTKRIDDRTGRWKWILAGFPDGQQGIS